jgi:hypothetical protein
MFVVDDLQCFRELVRNSLNWKENAHGAKADESCSFRRNGEWMVIA